MTYGEAIRTPGTRLHAAAETHRAMLARVAAMTPAEQARFWQTATKGER